ncbi:hypothetical protein M8C21_026908 [Ambrosia artemisiifolia]|uniref:Uncharacterized protein n=1 Tax=Ambrosia artemisiifolia TaxID=4212 RepID=A0AAD5G7K7_AMBAR|nr:hypothetical protein M8C21_026908 [Ambrosia artemisiifolia]
MDGWHVSEHVKGVSRSLTSAAEAIQEFGLHRGFKDDMLTLKHDFDKIQAVLHDAEDKRNSEIPVYLWLRSLRSVTLEVEDVVDEISTEALLQRLYKERGISNRVRTSSFSNHNLLMFRFRIAKRVKSIRRKLDAIASKISELNLTPSGAISHVDVGIENEIPDRLLTPDSFDSIDSDVVGREEELEMVIRTICNKDIGKSEVGEIRVYAIMGDQGLGKTTLAQAVYDHELVNQYFELKIWIDVFENLQLKEIINGIITFIDERKCTLTRLDLLQESLHKKLMGKKFLIILDDLLINLNEKANWDALRATLSCGAEGSIVLITTTSAATLLMMAKIHELRHPLSKLSEVDSWLLFRKLAFAQGRVGDDISELEPIGRELVRRCHGLPLALKTLGSLMWSKSSISDWQRVKDSKIWMLQQDWFLSALLVSYDNLPPLIKRCFSYCCLFPRGYDMEKEVVIQLWIVNGFIPLGGETDLHVLVDEIFNCLVWRSFFRVVKDKRYLTAPRYRMHDLMYHLANDITRDEREIHLSLSSPHVQFTSQDLGKLKSLRSMFLFGVECKFNINHMYLRVLYLSGSRLNTLPESICKLKHLRYLNLSYTSIKVLPDSIIFLQNLQVLLLNFCYNLCKLPEAVRYMSSLRLLELNSCHSLLYLPLGIKAKTQLPRLTRFHVGKKTPKIMELRNLNHFEGELEITGLENVEGFDEAKSADLKYKNLLALKLCWSNIHMRESKHKIADDEAVLYGLEPNSSLEKLSIYFFMGNIISIDWIRNLWNLVEIRFSGCKRCESILRLWSLPNLKVIKLLGMDSLVSFDEDDVYTSGGTDMFPSLEEIYIFMCPNLISLPSNLSALKILKLEECGALMSLPVQCFGGLKELKINGCEHLSQRYGAYEDKDWSKISHIPDITVDSLW